MTEEDREQLRRIEEVQRTSREEWQSLFVYRLGQVEQLAAKNEESIAHLTSVVEKMSAEVREFIASMPANYVPRKEHEARAERSFLERTQWPLVLFGCLGALSTALNSVILLAHHG